MAPGAQHDRPDDAKRRETRDAKRRETRDAKRRETRDAKRRETRDAKRRETRDAKRRETRDAERRETHDAELPGTRGAPRKAFLLRIPPTLHDELRRWASREMRSLNAQVEYLLREAVRKKRGPGDHGGEGDESGED